MLVADDALELAAGGADGLEQAVEADVVGHGDLEHIINNQVPRQQDEHQHHHNEQDGNGSIFSVSWEPVYPQLTPYCT